MKPSIIIALDTLTRPLTRIMPSGVVVSIDSKGRSLFLGNFVKEKPVAKIEVPLGIERVLWGMRFRSPIMNAAGMFKDAECYKLMDSQGSGGYLSGTTTANVRLGNKGHPFVQYHRSQAASNYLGLPNKGDRFVSRVLSHISEGEGCPIGHSVMASPDLSPDEQLPALVAGMRMFEEANVSWLEQNVSCPNTGHRFDGAELKRQLSYVSENFLKGRDRVFPVSVKLSNDTRVADVPQILDLLFGAGYDGVNFGNTSVDYDRHRKSIVDGELKLYDYFTREHGGGVSGAPLKEISLELAATAVRYLRSGRPTQEFHVFRTGGIECADDLIQSDEAGISMNQWFGGYWHEWAEQGHKIYQKLYGDYVRDKNL